MKTHPALLFAYRQLLRLYPPGFKERFSEEMLNIAESADRSEWPLIFGDTGLTIVCTWLQPEKRRLPLAATAPAYYVSLAQPMLKPMKLVGGLGMAALLVLIASYISTRTVWNLPAYAHDVCGNRAVASERR